MDEQDVTGSQVSARRRARRRDAVEVAREAWQGMWPGMEPDGTAEVIVAALAHHGMLAPTPSPATTQVTTEATAGAAADTGAVDNLRVAYEFLAQAVREDVWTRGLAERVQVSDIVIERGPRVLEHYQAGRCLWCGQRSAELGMFVCTPCAADPAMSLPHTHRANFTARDRAVAEGWSPPAAHGADVRFFRQVVREGATRSGAASWVYQVDTTRPDEDQVWVLDEGEWVLTEYENLARFLGNTTLFSPGTVVEITAQEAAAAHPAGSTDLPPVSDDDDL